VFDTITGLPIHPLVVHAVIVLVPLSALGAIAVALRARWNRRYGWLVVLGALAATGSAFVAKESGEALASRVGLPVEHEQIATWMPWLSGLMLVAVTALWWYDRGGDDRRTTLRTVLAVLTILTAVLALVWAIRAGHSGATAVWKPIVDNTTPGSFPTG
jgi:uncharacterized membrane protein